MNNWTISEEAKRMLAELKPLIERSVHLPSIYRCKYCRKILSVQSGARINYCDDWCKEMEVSSKINPNKRRECTICHEPLEPYLNKTGARAGQSSSVYRKYCDKCSPVKTRGRYNTIKLNRDIQ